MALHVGISLLFNKRLVSTASVITTILLQGRVLEKSPVIRPIVWPSGSSKVSAKRLATCSAAILLGSNNQISPPVNHSLSSKDKGSKVDFPAPGGATNTTRLVVFSCTDNCGSIDSMGSVFMGVLSKEPIIKQ